MLLKAFTSHLFSVRRIHYNCNLPGLNVNREIVASGRGTIEGWTKRFSLTSRRTRARRIVQAIQGETEMRRRSNEVQKGVA